MRRIPRHIAIIMDGNGRWAKERDLPRAEGHRMGAEAIERIVSACRYRGVKYVTLYAFSEENWQRPSEEVLSLMQLMRHFLVVKRPEMVKEGTRFRVIGDVERLPADVRQEIAETVEATARGRNITLVVALSYGGRQEIVRAVNRLIGSGASDVTVESLSGALDTAGMPDPDLLVRTSGEMRVSNFLLWQIAYTELYITDRPWPEFDEAELDRAIESYKARERRFGLTDEQLL
ncbi:MAG: di-trans,poly-cis-decaprenylcistransferase [Proteobacteria bacterium]|nr:di-trans,poly-cis-decaprenylcistransferase [Pseudomonadota bacterium]